MSSIQSSDKKTLILPPIKNANVSIQAINEQYIIDQNSILENRESNASIEVEMQNYGLNQSEMGLQTQNQLIEKQNS